jgi:hypothetical protein
LNINKEAEKWGKVAKDDKVKKLIKLEMDKKLRK